MYIGGYSEGVVTNNAIRGVNTAFNFMWVGNYASLCTHTPAGAQACFVATEIQKVAPGKCLEIKKCWLWIKQQNKMQILRYCRYCFA
jgi:hypothetical protein